MGQMTDAEPTFENISKEDLLSFLKERTKELKSAQRKLTKLEERYLGVLKETKAFKKAVDGFYASFGPFLTRWEVAVPSEEAERVARLEGVAETAARHVAKLAEAAGTSEKELAERVEEAQNKAQKQFQAQIAQLKQDLFSRDDRLRELERKLDEHERVNFDSLLAELRNVSGKPGEELDERIKESDRASEIITLKNEVRQLKERLAAEGKDANPSTHLNGHATHHRRDATDRGCQTDSAGHWDDEHSRHREETSLTLLKSHSAQAPLRDTPKPEADVRGYIKDLLLKYFQCEKRRQTEEKVLILNVLHDVLKFEYEDRVETTKIAREKGRLFNFI